jgi:hypothetical protein
VALIVDKGGGRDVQAFGLIEQKLADDQCLGGGMRAAAALPAGWC